MIPQSNRSSITRCLLSILLPGLLLVCCDKPDTSNTRTDDKPTTSRAQRTGRVPRENPVAAQDALRVALNAAKTIVSIDARQKVIADVAWSALEIDPNLARDAFQQLTNDNPDKIRLIQHFAMRLAEKNPDEALDWAATLDTEQQIAAAKGQIALALAETDPQRAANLLSESGIVGRDFDVVLVQVLQRWAAQSAPDAAAWAISFPPGEARETGINLIVSQWMKTDAQSAFPWMTALQNPMVRKEAVLAMEEAILQQPQSVRDAWLQYADAQTIVELEQQHEQALKNIGDNVPLTEK